MSGAGGAEVGGSVAVTEDAVAVGVAVADEEFGSGGGEVDERHVKLLGHEFHLVRIVHRVVGNRYFLVCLDAVGGEDRELVAEVVAAVALDGVAGEVHAAYGGNEDGGASCRAAFVDIFAEIFLVGAARGGAAVVGGGCGSGVADRGVVGFEFVAVHAGGLLVVVGELNHYIVAGLELLFNRGPVSGFFIETLARCSVFATVVHLNAF